ncbi:heat-shock protein [Seonamhaeicola sp. S2-3]|uniref:TetR/AcrR family transcriptional regulator n=1 Tax=Seonamhaeicola sp. S2-3 TaxID=1936081 RepID=UPI000972C4BB|nr:TetR/AcrR family transcriptional regulator [Seonamhaeicola sp. S2-3]APY12665.1 heat-shock protein [Seonamhaeicola sp. S2-3]
MSDKKRISKQDIIKQFMNYVLEHNANPNSVYTFAKLNGFNEAEFYKYFASFEAIEKDIFETFSTNTIKVLNSSEDYNAFDARNKLLSFYYTFFENLTANRSYIKLILNKHKNSFKGLKTLSGLKQHYTNYVGELDIQTLDVKQEQLEKLQDSALKESAWIQLLITIKFWLEDTSVSFEKTDVFIEKSVNTTFDVLDVAPLKSVIDLGKFLFKEQFQMN